MSTNFTYKGKAYVPRFDVVYDNGDLGARWKARIGDSVVELIRRPGKQGYVATLNAPMPAVRAGTPAVPFSPQLATLAFQADDDDRAMEMALGKIAEHIEASMEHWHALFVNLIFDAIHDCPARAVAEPKGDDNDA